MNLTVTDKLEHLERMAEPRNFDVPLVSVIVINYNYGRFLRQAVASVFEQTYPNIECIVVDNASTDDSAEILRDLSRHYRTLAVLQREQNDGQSVASVEGFAASSGDYVVFLDADDVLLPAFVETHIFVHLSLRVPVGFSSSDVIQAVNSRMVLGTYYGFSEYVRSGRGKAPDLLRRFDATAPAMWPLPSPDASIETQVHLVHPCDVGRWRWAPTSGNCFRRDALQMFLNNQGLGALRSCTDAYLLRGISVLMGSVLIDRPLAVYRLHGMNVFSKHPHLYCVLSYERGGLPDNDQLGRIMIIDHLIANAKLMLGKLHAPEHFTGALLALDEVWPRIPSEVQGCRSYLAGKLVTEFRTLLRELGLSRFVALAVRLKVAPHVIAGICLRSKLQKGRPA